MLQTAASQLVGGMEQEQRQQQQQQQQQQHDASQEETIYVQGEREDEATGPAGAEADADTGSQAPVSFSPNTPEEMLRLLKDWLLPEAAGPALKKQRAESGVVMTQSDTSSACPTPMVPVATSDEALADVLRRAQRVVPKLAKKGL